MLVRVGRALVDLPCGTVTFLFTDIEGSTRLLTRLGDRYAQVLAAHERAVRAAIGASGGCEIGTHGDAFFVAFARARDAIEAAVAAQRTLASIRWPHGADVRVRMGVHTGEAELHGVGYVGLDVNRASRICAAGHGGQILVSSTTRELVADTLARDVSLRDLGLFGLKDLARPERLSEVAGRGLAAGFPPLRATPRLLPSPDRAVVDPPARPVARC